jgi:signal transduction histidine kinase
MNAIDAMPRGGNLTIRTSLVAEHAEVRLEVRDDGTGISPEARANLFEPFYTTKDRGTGLGLAISKGIVERHRGRLDVESEPGQGSTFIVTLPLDGVVGTPVKAAEPAAVKG